MCLQRPRARAGRAPVRPAVVLLLPPSDAAITTACRGLDQLVTSASSATPTACGPSVAKPCRVSALCARTSRPHASDAQNARHDGLPAPLGPAAAPLAARSAPGAPIAGSCPISPSAPRTVASAARISSVPATWGVGGGRAAAVVSAAQASGAGPCGVVPLAAEQARAGSRTARSGPPGCVDTRPPTKKKTAVPTPHAAPGPGGQAEPLARPRPRLRPRATPPPRRRR
jgi:hypothetical protein